MALKKIGEILKDAREDKDLTQTEVMKRIGINNKTLSGYENGIAEPDIETMVKLFNLYEISADKVLGIKNFKSAAPFTKAMSLENNLLKEIRRLTPKQQEELLVMLKALNKFQIQQKEKK